MPKTKDNPTVEANSILSEKVRDDANRKTIELAAAVDDTQPTAPEAKRYRRIAICGTSETTRHLAPIDAKRDDGSYEWEVWTLGNGYKAHPRQDRHFQLHDLETGAARWSDAYKEWLSSTKIPVVLQRQHEWVPSGVPFPLQEIMQRFPSGEYLTCMIAEMVAMAVHEGVEEIGIWGCDLAHDSEYAYQRPAVEYWLGLARGMGIKVTVPATSDLLKCHEVYGFETHGGMSQGHLSRMMDARLAEIEKRLAGHKAQYDNHRKAVDVLQGAHENMRWIKHSIGMHSNHTGGDQVMQKTELPNHLSDGAG